MKKLSKNILMILICFMLIFSLHIVHPHKKAKADFGITALTVGGIALATLAIGGLSHLAINEDARKAVVNSSVTVFNNATESVKQDFTDAIERTRLGLDTGIKLASATWDWIQEVATKSIANDLTNWMPFLSPTIDYNKATLLRTINQGYLYGIYELDQYINTNGKIYKGLAVEINLDGTLATRNLSTRIIITDLNIDRVNAYGGINTSKSYYKTDSNGFLIGSTYAMDSLIDMDIYHQVDHWADQVGSSLDRVFEASRERGKLNVPIDGLMGIGDGSVGLHYDLSADRWVVSQTGEHWLGDVALDLDQIGVITDASTGAITYDPSLDIPNVGIRDVTGTITNPITGENVGTIETDIPIDGSFPIDQTDAPPIDIPVPPPSVPGQINWDKLKFSGELFTTAFPFSLPFDVYNALNASFVSINNPDFSGWDLPIKFNGKTYDFKVKIPDEILMLLPYWNAFVLISFDIGLIYAIRKLFGGAS